MWFWSVEYGDGSGNGEELGFDIAVHGRTINFSMTSSQTSACPSSGAKACHNIVVGSLKATF
jgi:hypothetical protein